MLKITARKDADIVTGDLPCSLCPFGYGRTGNFTSCSESFRKKYGEACTDKFVTIELKFKKK